MNRRPLGPWSVPLLIAVCALLQVSCETSGRRVAEPPMAPPSIRPEVELTNTAAYPEGSYTIKPGDTPSGIAGRLGVEQAILALANGWQSDTVLKAGDMIIVPRVADRSEPRTTGPQEKAAVPAPPLVTSDGKVLAIIGGTISAVHRGYPGLGDVVIIENDLERVIVSGTFTPAVEKGARVTVGSVLGTGAEKSRVKASRVGP